MTILKPHWPKPDYEKYDELMMDYRHRQHQQRQKDKDGIFKGNCVAWSFAIALGAASVFMVWDELSGVEPPRNPNPQVTTWNPK